MVHRITLLASALLVCVGVADGWAQQRTITGRVTNALSGGPVAGATVAIVGTATVAATNDRGEFTVSAPPGGVTLAVRAIGYKRGQASVAAGQSSVNFALEQDVFNLEAIVVSGQATGIERRNAPNAVATVSGVELARVAAPSVEIMLAGRVPGAAIQTNSGAPGGGVQVALRGTTSVFGAATPLYVVDGVIVSDAAIPNNQEVISASNKGSNPSPLQQDQINRVADLNPDDIGDVEILKGASASAIYGSKASNGVVVITTHHGQLGAPRFTVRQRFGVFDLAHELGSRVFKDSNEAVAAFGAAAAAFFRNNSTNPNWGQPNFVPGQAFDHEKELSGGHNLSTETALNVSGGDANTRYYVGGLIKDDEGIELNTGYKRQSLRLNLDQHVSSRFNISFSSDLVHSLGARGLNNNDNNGVSYYMALQFIPSFLDLRQKPDSSWGSTLSPINFIQSNPLQTAALMVNDEDVWRYLGGARATFELYNAERHNLRLIGNGGVDWFGQKNTLYFPPELQFMPVIQPGKPGASLLTNGDNLNTNYNLNLVHTYRPGGLVATTSAGVQEEDYDLNIGRIVSKNLPPGLSNVNAGTDVSVNQRREQVRDFGFYGQEELLLRDERLLLTFGARADRSSNNGDQHHYSWYPKAAASYRLLNPLGGVEEAKLRLAFGQTGNRPSYGQRFTELDATQGIGGLPGLTVPGIAGSPDIKPERQTEIEGGVDAILWGGRGTLELTLYQKSVSDLLLPHTLAPSTGFTSQFLNGGKLRNRGIEVALGYAPLNRPDFQWVSRASFWMNRSRVMELPGGDTTGFRVGGFGCSDGCFFLKPGQSATSIFGNKGLDQSGVCCALGKIGDASPDFKLAWTNEMTHGAWNFSMLWDLQHGANVINLTKLLYDLGQVTQDYANPLTAAQATARGCTGSTVLGQCRLTQYGLYTGTYTERASYLKMREVTLTWSLPPSVVAHLWAGARDVRLSLSGRNLIVITPYTGMDPEVSNFGNQPVQRNIDVAPYPRSRSFWFTISAGF
ncbi:MAG TPA: SusC/RagA family TonB-linked outer membrane protein [Gemmatimonadales bacterium]|nr:SusC/RagA family TonB-linked outer membrane protein [Gemmatimonadales bacterium]